MKIPDTYNQLMPYLVLKGTGAFRKFMADVFDAREQMIVPADDGTVMHGELKLGEAVIMFAETGGQFPVMNAGLFIYVDNADITYQKALAAGAVTLEGQEPADKEYGRTCGIKDPFGNSWWITSVI